MQSVTCVIVKNTQSVRYKLYFFYRIVVMNIETTSF
jgi:hypothetical protein